MPKSGSSSTANIIANFPNIRLADLVPGYDIREQEIDLQILERTLSLNTESSFVAQHHVCLSFTTQYLIDSKHLTPLVTTRNLPDALISLVDHFQVTDNARENFLLPTNFNELPLSRRIDYVIHFYGPWYLKFFKSWIRYDRFHDVWLRYEELARSNLHYLEKISSALNLAVSDNALYASAQAGQIIGNKRFNKGVSGRGQELMSPDQLALLRMLIDLAEIPAKYHEYLRSGTYADAAAGDAVKAAA